MKKAAHKGGFSYPKLVILSEVSRQANAVEGPMQVKRAAGPALFPTTTQRFPAPSPHCQIREIRVGCAVRPQPDLSMTVAQFQIIDDQRGLRSPIHI